MECRSRAASLALANDLLMGKYSMDSFMELFNSDDYRVCQRSAWPLTMIAETRPDMLYPYLSRMYDMVISPKHDAVLRNIVRSWQFMVFPGEYEGMVYDRCYRMISDSSYPHAVRAYAVTVCVNIAERHPDLIEECDLLLQNMSLTDIPSIKGRIKQESKRLTRMKKTLRNN